MFRHALNENVTEIIVAVYSLKMTENSGIINNTYYFFAIHVIYVCKRHDMVDCSDL